MRDTRRCNAQQTRFHGPSQDMNVLGRLDETDARTSDPAIDRPQMRRLIPIDFPLATRLGLPLVDDLRSDYTISMPCTKPAALM